MKNLLNANKKTKVIFLVGLVLILLAITIIINLIVVNASKTNEFEKYGKTSFDDIVTLSVSMYENRDSSKTKDNQSNDFETSKYNFDVFVTKLDVTGYKTKIRYMRCHLTVETINNKLVYKDSEQGSISTSSTSTAISESSKYTPFSFSNVLKKTIQNVSTSVENVDETPKKVYVKLYYIAEVRNTQSNESTKKERTIDYQTSITSNTDLKKAKTIRELDDVSSGNIKNTGKEVFDLNVNYTKAITISTDRVQYNDKFVFQLKANKANLGTSKVKNMSFEIIGLLKNDEQDFDEKFANAVYIGCFYGALPTASDLSKITNEIDSIYELNELRVYVNISFNNNKTYKTSFTLTTDQFGIYPEK